MKNFPKLINTNIVEKLSPAQVLWQTMSKFGLLVIFLKLWYEYMYKFSTTYIFLQTHKNKHLKAFDHWQCYDIHYRITNSFLIYGTIFASQINCQSQSCQEFLF